MDETAATAVTETPTTLSLQTSPLPSLPFELVSEILCRLPVKLLLQLRCLCKSFNALISDPKFIRKHLRISTACHRHRLLLISLVYSRVLSYPLHSTFITLTDNPTPHQYPVSLKDQGYYNFGSCDGMFCFEVNSSVFIWNPSIQKFKTLPSLDLAGFPAYGFGFDTSIHNYKVVCVLCYLDNQGLLGSTNIMIHTLGTDFWRMIPGEFPVPVSRSLTLASGTLNWFAYNDYSIVSFDLVNESYRKFSTPKYGGEDVVRVVLDVLRDCLCILAHSCTFCSVWMMKEFGNEESWTQLWTQLWTRLFHVSFYDICTRPIWIFEDDQVLMKKNMDLSLCDFKNGAFKIKKTQNINHFNPKVYIESLVSLVSNVAGIESSYIEPKRMKTNQCQQNQEPFEMEANKASIHSGCFV